MGGVKKERVDEIEIPFCVHSIQFFTATRSTFFYLKNVLVFCKKEITGKCVLCYTRYTPYVDGWKKKHCNRPSQYHD